MQEKCKVCEYRSACKNTPRLIQINGSKQDRMKKLEEDYQYWKENREYLNWPSREACQLHCVLF
jgi:hypothetical protein